MGSMMYHTLKKVRGTKPPQKKRRNIVKTNPKSKENFAQNLLERIDGRMDKVIWRGDFSPKIFIHVTTGFQRIQVIKILRIYRLACFFSLWFVDQGWTMTKIILKRAGTLKYSISILFFFFFVINKSNVNAKIARFDIILIYMFMYIYI